MKKVTHVPWDVAEEATKVAARANERYWSHILSTTAVSCVLIYDEPYLSVAFLFLGILVGRSNSLLRRFETRSWCLMCLLAVLSILASYVFRSFEFSNILFDFYPKIEFFLPAIFSIPAGIIAGNIGSKVEVCFFKSKGYDYTGYLGNLNYAEEDL